MSTKKLLDNFHIWLKQKNIDITGAKYESYPLNCDYQGMEFGNIFLIGDAAGLIYRFTGEGIHPAMISGEEIGKKIIDPNYKISIDEILKKKKQQFIITNILVNSRHSIMFIHKLMIFLMKRKIFKNKIFKILT